MPDTAEDILRQFEDARPQRDNFASVWQEIADNLLGRRDFTTDAAPGRKRMSKIYDTTGLQAVGLLAAALHSFLTNPALRWMRLRFENDPLNDDEAARLWLDAVEDRLLDAFNAPDSNFASQIHEVYLDQVAFGTAALYIGDRPGRSVLFSSRPLGEIHILENAEGRVDTVYRRFKFTARQAEQTFGDAIGPKIRAAIDSNKPETMFGFLHCVKPRKDGQTGAFDARNLPFASYYIALDDKKIVAEGGYHEMPYMVPRWSKDPGEMYGRSPGWNALPEVKMLNEMSKTTLKAAQKAVDPPLLIADDGVVMPLRTQPGGINVVRAGALQNDPMRPLQNNARIDIGLEMMEQRRDAVRSAFHYNLLQLFQDPRMTATQVLQLVQEMQRLMGPMLGRQQAELLEPMVDRVFGILDRAGELPAHPDSIRSERILVEYNSPVAAAQKAGDASAVELTWAAAQAIAATSPDVLDELNPSESLRIIAEARGMPQRGMRSAEDVKAIREQRAAQQQEQAGLDQAEQMAGMMGLLGKAGSEAANAA